MEFKTIGTLLTAACLFAIPGGFGCSSSGGSSGGGSGSSGGSGSGGSGSGGSGSSGGSSSGGESGPAAALDQRFIIPANQPSTGWESAPADAGTNEYTNGGATWTGTIQDWYNSIDGAAQPYEAANCQEILVQNLVNVNSSTTALENGVVIAADCGTAANSVTMYQSAQALYAGENLTLTGYDTSIAFATGAIGAGSAYAHFGQYYFEIDLSGYATQTAALSDLPQFVAYLSSKSQ